MCRSGAPAVYVDQAPVDGSIRSTSSLCQSQAYTMPAPSTAIPRMLPPVFATSSIAPSSVTA